MRSNKADAHCSAASLQCLRIIEDLGGRQQSREEKWGHQGPHVCSGTPEKLKEAQGSSRKLKEIHTLQ
jgi:hypothetical protein